MDSERCWFCERRDADGKHASEIELHRSVKPPGGPAVVVTTKLPVPRCRSCRKGHGRELLVAVLFFLAGGLGGIAAYGLAFEWIARVTGWAIFAMALFVACGTAGGVLGMLVSFPLARLVRGRTRPTSHEDTYPAVREALADGWKRGSAPKAAKR